MFNWIKQHVLTVMRVPHAPEPPSGAPDSVRIFRAGSNYYKLCLGRWALRQLGALAGLIFSVALVWEFTHEVAAAKQIPPETATQIANAHPAQESPISPKALKSKKIKRDKFKEFAAKTPAWVIPIIGIFEIGGILLFLVQIPVTLAMTRLEYELHWYIVTDRSLRIRTGVLRLQESTMSFANLQQVEVKQGPLQRILGLADVHVQSAGGGGDQKSDEHETSLHTGIFHSVENATEIRDLIAARLKRFREAGLGDPEEHHSTHPVMPGEGQSPALAAALELRTESRLFREALISNDDSVRRARGLA